MTERRVQRHRSVHPRAPGGGLRRLRLAAGVGLLGVGLATSVALIPPTVTYADSQAVALDRQAYVPDAGPDQYQADALSGGGCGAAVGQCPAPDPNAIHVAADKSTMTYHSLVHVELDPLANQTVTSLVVTLTVIGGTGANGSGTTPQDNVNTAAAILDAYPLANEFLASFNGCQASATCTGEPTIDTSGPKVVGKVATDSAGNIVSFSFDVGPMLRYWSAKGTNTGFAVVPDAAAATTAWAIAFDRTLGTATATVASSQAGSGPVATPGNSSISGTLGGGGSNGGGGGGGGSRFPTAAPTVAATAAPKPSPAHAAGPIGSTLGRGDGGTGGTGGSGIPLWLLVLGVSLAGSAALLAQPVSQALSATGGVRLGLVRELKIHPRMFAVAGTVLVWSSAWGVYAGATNAGSAGGSRPAVAAANGNSSIPAYAPDTAGTPAPTASGAAGGGGSGGGGGGGGGGTINGAPIGAAAFAGGNVPNAPSAQLYTGGDNTVGITDTSIQMCAHAALTFGPAFNIGAADLNVFWQMVNNPATDPYPHSPGQGGIYNRKIVQPGGADGIAIQDDGYQPSKAVQAAQACQQQQGGDFFLLSGIGFDQIPNVRVWAEQNHMLYIHHIATQQGTAGLQYSFTMLPTLENIGTQYAQYYLSHLSGKKIGIIERGSSNWSPGIATFKAALKAAGQSGNIGPDDQVSNNQGDYSKEIIDMQTAGMDAVFIWENALAADSIIQQSANQNYFPKWLGFPFNLTLYTLNQSGNNGQEIQGMQGLIPWPAYTSSSARCASGGSGITRNDADYARYLKDIQAFETAYANLDKGANLCGDGGDLLFGTWEAWSQVADLLVQCGPSCDRNKIAGLMLSGYRSQVGANCPVDFRGGDHHHGGVGGEDVYATKQENGGPGWINTGYCETTIR